MALRSGGGGKKKYIGHGGELIPHLGELAPGIMTENGALARMKFQDTEVRKPLLAASAIADKGNLTVFDEGGSYIIPKGSKLIDQIRKLLERTDKKIPLHRRNGVYNMKAWLLPEQGFSRQGR